MGARPSGTRIHRQLAEVRRGFRHGHLKADGGQLDRRELFDAFVAHGLAVGQFLPLTARELAAQRVALNAFAERDIMPVSG